MEGIDVHQNIGMHASARNMATDYFEMVLRQWGDLTHDEASG
jgi:hypothetical protein